MNPIAPTPSPFLASDVAALSFNNAFTAELPADPDDRNERRQVFKACYSRVKPEAVPAPRLVAASREVAAMIGLSEAALASPAFVEIFSGKRVLPEMDPHAMCYGGHQFGHWAGQLGDGRAIVLGEVDSAAGGHYALQLKGAGPTPYSRGADGLAVLRSSIREFLCSEAMHHLGVPTTRALSVVTTGRPVVRDMFYDGNPQAEPGAVVCRVAPSFLRFGNFQLHAFRREHEVLRQLADFTIRREFPHLGTPCTETYRQWLAEVSGRTAEMIVKWMMMGFVHGVMNTDNMSILGLTIDYGPYGWLEGYDPNWTPNTTDAQGRRYRYANQPQVAAWNLVQFAQAILPLVGDEKAAEAALATYGRVFTEKFRESVAAKLGLPAFDIETDDALFDDLLDLLTTVETDMTIFFRRLADVSAASPPDESPIPPVLMDAYYDPDAITNDYRLAMGKWLDRYRRRCQATGVSDAERRSAMNRVNPKFVLRNYLAQQAIDAAEQGDFTLTRQTLEVLRRPFDEQPAHEATFAGKRPEWARSRPGCSMLSCSS